MWLQPVSPSEWAERGRVPVRLARLPAARASRTARRSPAPRHVALGPHGQHLERRRRWVDHGIPNVADLEMRAEVGAGAERDLAANCDQVRKPGDRRSQLNAGTLGRDADLNLVADAAVRGDRG